MNLKQTINLLAILALALGLLGMGQVTPASQPESGASAAPWQAKVDAWVLESAASGQTEFLVYLSEQADLSGAAELATKAEKGQFVYEALTSVAARTQAPLIAVLEAQGLEYRPYWVTNLIWVRGDLSAVQSIAARSDVAHVYANPWVHNEIPKATLPDAPLPAPEAIEWNITKVNADDVWALGYTGQGVVVGGQDTGYDWDHPALIDQYRGWNGSAANHNYNWHDAIHENNPSTPPGNSCGFDSAVPCDDNGHGTHTMGTMVGDDGGSNQIGMAPGARWIGCRNMEDGWGMPSTYIECYQWFIAPTDLSNNNPQPTLAPDVINNSWGCPTYEGCNPNSLLSAVQAVRAAGIMTVHSAGNGGSACSSVNDPAAIYAESFTVGNTTSTDTISGSSSRGPVTVDGSNRMKPDISAPGSNIRSSTPGTGYTYLSGTSMAGPHVAGLVALLISAYPSSAGQIDTLEDVIEQSALHLTSTQTCGGVPGATIPNNTFGWGRIDALAAYESMEAPHSLAVGKTASAAYVQPGDLLTYTLAVTHTHLNAPTTSVILTDRLPANTTFVSATMPYDILNNTLTWQKSSQEPGEVWQVELVVLVDEDARGTIANEVYSVSSADVTEVSGAPVVTPVNIHALGLEKQVSAAQALPGAVLTYTLGVTNLSEDQTAHSLTLTDTLPEGTVFVSASTPYNLVGDQIEWTVSEMTPGADFTAQLVVQILTETVGTVSNALYGVNSAEVPEVLRGAPVNTNVPAVSFEFSGSQQDSAFPGEEVVFAFSLHNSGTISDTYTISHSGGSVPGWVFGYNSEITVGAGETVWVPLLVGSPFSSLNGAQGSITLHVQSQTLGWVVDEAEATLTVAYVSRIVLPAVLNGEGSPRGR